MLYGEIAEQQNPWWREGRVEDLAPSRPNRRFLCADIAKHIHRNPRRALLLRGPRQVGKTTMLLQSISDLLAAGWPASNISYFDFSDERVPLKKVSPEELVKIQPPGVHRDRPRLLVLDEIGSAREWSRWLKRAVDRQTHRIVATDSSAALLQEGSEESGVGRWDQLDVEGLTYNEFLSLQRRSDENAEDVEERLPSALEQYLARGGFPEFVQTDPLPLVWRRLRDDIANKAIRRDLARRNPVDGERVTLLLRYLLESSGSLFDAKKIGESFQQDGRAPDQRSMEKWVRMLEDAMLVTRLERWQKQPLGNVKARLHPKFYASDHGLLMAFSLARDPRTDPDVRARTFEAIVFRHLREHARVSGAKVHLYRPKKPKQDEGAEVDFLVQGSDLSCAVEVTHSRRPERKKLTRLKQLAADLEVPALLVYGGLAEEVRDGVRCLPLRTFVSDVKQALDSHARSAS